MTRFPAVGGGGGEQPIASKDRAETFEESDVTVSGGLASVDNGAVSISPTSLSTTYNQQDRDVSGKYGVRFVPDVDAAGVFVSNFSAQYIESPSLYLYDDDNTLLDETTPTEYEEFNWEGTLSADLTAGTPYKVVGDDSGDVHYSRYSTSPTPEVSGSGITITDGLDGGLDAFTSSKWPSILGLQLVDPVSGSATVEWPQPLDIYRWDAATFQSSTDGETVEVYVEESTDGGDSWTEIQGPIGRGDQINADPGSRVRFRVELARSDTSNNPTLDAIYRRWVV